MGGHLGLKAQRRPVRGFRRSIRFVLARGPGHPHPGSPDPQKETITVSTSENLPSESSRSSFKLVRNAKMETQIEVKTYALGDTPEDELAARNAAVEHYEHLRVLYP
jgi:hypothetical protein